MKLTVGIEKYVQCRRSKGYVFGKGQASLLAFSRLVGDVDLNQVESTHVLHFLEMAQTSIITWRLKYQILNRFFSFWCDQGETSQLLMPKARPYVRQSFVPYVFSKHELRALLLATKWNDNSRSSIDRQTMRTLILLLYGTGAMVGEVLKLRLADVDLDNSQILIRGKGAIRFRLIPVGRDLLDILRRYVSWRSRKKYSNQILLITKEDNPIRHRTVGNHFRRVRRIARVGRRDNCRIEPRMEDLRFSFAVHRIAAWIRAGADLNRMLPALAAYMGQIGLGSTERYLRMTPDRFRKHLSKLSPNRRNSHWRDDAELMHYLERL